MSQEGYSLDIGETLEKQEKAEKQLEEQKKAEAQKEKEKISGSDENKKTETQSRYLQKFLKKYNKIIIIALIAIIIFVSVYIRVYALSMPGLDALVKQNIERSFKEEIANNIAKEHVGPVDPAIMKEEVEARFRQLMENPKTQIAIRKSQTQQRQEFYDINGNLYLYNFDPYLYMRYARNILRNGGMGEKIKNGMQLDDLRNAPHGTGIEFNLLPYYEVILYRILAFFIPDIEIEGAVIMLPIIFAALSAIIVFLIIKRLTNAYGAFIGSLLFAIHPFIIGTTSMTDTQSPSIFFTLLAVWLAIEIVLAKKLSLRFWILCLTFLAAFILYRCAWSGYYYIYAIIASYAIIYVSLLFIRSLLRKEKLNKKYILGFFAIIALPITYLVIRPGVIEHILSRLNVGERAEFFPTAFSMILELRRITIFVLIQRMGGYALFTAAALTLIYLIYSSFKNKLEGNARFELFIVYWFLGLLVVSILAQRFAVYFSIPFAISIGLGAGYMYPYFGKLPDALNLHEYKKCIRPILVILTILFMIFLLKGNLSKQFNSVPTNVDDTIHGVCMDIKSHSKSNAIINTWWDDGYLLEYYAERPVLFDGGSFNSPVLYWLAKAFTSTNINYSMNVLRMLDCGATGVFDEIALKKGRPESIDIINKILEAGKEKSKKIAKDEKLDASTLNKIFCSPPEAFVVISENMVKLFKFYEEVARTDFRARELKGKIQGMESKEAIAFLEKEYKLSKEDAYELYGRIYSDNSDIPLNIEFFNIPCIMKKESVNCQGLTLDIKSGIAKDANDKVYPNYLVTNESVIKNLNVDNDVTLIFYQDHDLMKVVAVGSEIRDSLIIKAYFLNAYDIPQLELISYRSSTIGNKVKTYKINWTN